MPGNDQDTRYSLHNESSLLDDVVEVTGIDSMFAR